MIPLPGMSTYIVDEQIYVRWINYLSYIAAIAQGGLKTLTPDGSYYISFDGRLANKFYVEISSHDLYTGDVIYFEAEQAVILYVHVVNNTRQWYLPTPYLNVGGLGYISFFGTDNGNYAAIQLAVISDIGGGGYSMVVLGVQHNLTDSFSPPA